jgi:hypothetical protein
MKDLLLDSNFDVLIENGDLVYGESTRQHQELLILTQHGEWRESPMVGIGAATWLDDELNGANLAAAIKAGFEGDGMTVLTIKSVIVDNKWTLTIEALW